MKKSNAFLQIKIEFYQVLSSANLKLQLLFESFKTNYKKK